jgi:hypothetical protein
LALQIIDDFQKGLLKPEVSLTDEQQNNRGKLLSSLLIDTTLRKADFAKYYCD